MHIIISRIAVLGIRWDPEPTFEYTSFWGGGNGRPVVRHVGSLLCLSAAQFGMLSRMGPE